MINTKEDFKGKCIKLPKNISKKKFNKIKSKLEKLGFKDFWYFQYCFIGSNYYMFIWDDGDVGVWEKKSLMEQIESPQEISIKEFLAEPKNENLLNIKLENRETIEISALSIEQYRGGVRIKAETKGRDVFVESNGIVEWGSSCLKDKEREKLYDDLAEGKIELVLTAKQPKEFKTAEEAIKWCYNNPMKEISYKVNGSKIRGRFNNGVGLLGKQRYFEFRYDNGRDKDWRVDEDCFAKNFNSVNKNWLNIRECK